MTADKLTDERIIDIATKTRSADPGRDGYILPILFARAIESEVRALLAGAAEGWQPIETAPKDGRGLLLGHFNSHGKWRTIRGKWFSAAVIAETWEDDEADEGWYEVSIESDDIPNCWWTDPTHWMPLPAAPGAAAPLAITPAQVVEELANSFHQIAPGTSGFAASEDSARPVAGAAPMGLETPHA